MQDTDEHLTRVQIKRMRRMNTVDVLPQPLRELVNEYGFNVVWQFLQLRIVDPKHIRHLVETVLDEFSPTRGSRSAQGIRSTDGWQSEGE